MKIEEIKRKLDEWFDSPDRKEDMREAIAQAEATKQMIHKAFQIDYRDLDAPITI